MVDYLKTRTVTVFEGSDDLNRNEAFEHLARHLGAHFEVLSPFYEKVKRCVATNRGQRIDIDHFSDQERSAAVQFGTLLHRHGMLKDFYYHRSPKKQLRVIPTKDGQVGQFLTGGWLEIYVSLQLQRRLKAKFSPAKFQLLYNVKGTLPDGREFEADLMAAVEGKLFWLECKTGHWQDYAARFRGLVDIFGVDRASGALLLIRPPDQGTRQRATDMLNMTLLSLNEVDGFINNFLGLEGEDAAAMVEEPDALPVGVVPPLSDDEIPLENAPAAKTLGRVSLDGSDEEESSDGPRRKRRRRRGGRGRGRNRGSEAEAGKAGSLHEKHEMQPLDDEAEAKSESEEPSSGSTSLEELAKMAAELKDSPASEDSAPEPAAEATEASEAEAPAEEEEADPLADLPPGMVAGGTASESEDEEAKPKRKRSRGRRGGKGRKPAAEAEASADSPDSGEANAEVAEAPAEEQASEGADEKSESKPKRSRRRPRKSPFAVDEDAAEAAEAAEGDDAKAKEVAAPAASSIADLVVEPAAEPVAEEAPESPEQEAPAAEESETEPEVVAEVEPEPEPEVEEEAADEQPKTSPKGTVIAPDLAAMMAGSAPKKDEDE